MSDGLADIVKKLVAGAAIVSSLAASGCYMEPWVAYAESRPFRSSKEGVPQNSGENVIVIPSEAKAGYAKQCYQDTRGARICKCWDRKANEYEWCTLIGGNND